MRMLCTYTQSMHGKYGRPQDDWPPKYRTIGPLKMDVWRPLIVPPDEFQLPFIMNSGIFLETNFKYKNVRNNEFGGATFAKYGGFFTISCWPFNTFRARTAPWIGSMDYIPFEGPNPAGIGISLELLSG